MSADDLATENARLRARLAALEQPQAASREAPSLFENLKRICFGQAPPVFAPKAPEAAPAEGLGSPGFGERSAFPPGDEPGDAAATPPRSARRLSFASDVEFRYVETIDEQPAAERRDVWWTHRDYQQIRARQRELILLVLKQAHDYPAGVVPPPIPGESRRGLGICCEPGTNSGRASRVKTGLRQIVRAHRSGMGWRDLAALSAELSEWAATNAREVGLKDHSAAADKGDFARTFFLHGSVEGAAPGDAAAAGPARRAHSATRLGARDGARGDEVIRSPPRKARSDPTLASGVAHAHRRDATDREAAPGIGLCATLPATVAHAQRRDDEPKTTGLGSMVRVDSLTNLAAASTAHLGSAPWDAAPPPPAKRDGLGLASMIRNDSLGNLQSAAAAATREPRRFA